MPKRNRIFAQVAIVQYGVICLLLSLAYIYVFKWPHTVPLGLAIIGSHLLIFGIFCFASRNVLVVDEKFRNAAIAAQNGVWQHIAMLLLWLIAAVIGLIVVGSDEDVSSVAVFTMVMCIVLLLTLTRRAFKVIRLSRDTR